MSMYPQLVQDGAILSQINRMIGQRINRKALFQKIFERSADGKQLSTENRAQILTQALSIQLNPKEAEQMRLAFASLDQKIADATRDIISNNEKWIQKNENLDELLKNDDLILSALQSLDPQRGGLEYQA